MSESGQKRRLANVVSTSASPRQAAEKRTFPNRRSGPILLQKSPQRRWNRNTQQSNSEERTLESTLAPDLESILLAEISKILFLQQNGPEVDISPGTEAFFRTCAHRPKALI